MNYFSKKRCINCKHSYTIWCSKTHSIWSTIWRIIWNDGSCTSWKCFRHAFYRICEYCFRNDSSHKSSNIFVWHTGQHRYPIVWINIICSQHWIFRFWNYHQLSSRYVVYLIWIRQKCWTTLGFSPKFQFTGQIIELAFRVFFSNRYRMKFILWIT